MILDGERMKELVASASEEVILCAPFIKVTALRALLSVVREGVKLSVYTRWRPEEVASGVSDLAVFDVLKDREKTEIRLLNELHAKLVVADDRCLAGSANITGAALGWSKKPNIELVIDKPRSDPQIRQLLERLSHSEVATYQIKEDIEAQAKRLDIATAAEFDDNENDDATEVGSFWLPKCAAPEKLYQVYLDANTDAVTSGTSDDALSDLRALMPPQGMTEKEFEGYIAGIFSQLPAVKEIIEKVPGRVRDAQGIAIMAELKPELTEKEHEKQWAVVRDWIRIFFSDKFEVAPESYVVRLKSDR